MHTLVTVLTIIAALGCAVIGGIFFAFSTFIMNALSQLPASQGIAAMQNINRVILRSLFIPVFMGTALICGILIVLALWNWSYPAGLTLIIGSLLYIVGTFLVTIVFNVPRNNKLEAAASDDAASLPIWVDYLSGWTAWNHVRSAAALAASAMFIAALVYIPDKW